MSVGLRDCCVCAASASVDVDGVPYCDWCRPEDPLEARLKAAIANHYRTANPHLPERNHL